MTRRPAVVVLACLLGASLVATFVVSLLFDAYKIPSEAMAPTLEPGDRVLARPIGGSDVKRGDIVIFRAPPGSRGPAHRISRVVAVGGDRIENRANRLVLNGRVAVEPYLAPGTVTYSVDPQTVPLHRMYLMGDNRTNSQDSRFYGPLATSRVVARVSIENLPLDLIFLGATAALGLALAIVVWATRRTKDAPSPGPTPAS